MNRFLAILVGVACCFATATSLACSPGAMNEQVARQLDAAYIGEVTESTWVPADYQLLVTVKVDEVLKGAKQAQLVAPLQCFQSIEKGRKVIVLVKDGVPAVWHSEYYEDEIRTALRRGR